MDKIVNSSKESAVVVLNTISKLIRDIEKKILLNNIKAIKCEELKLLKEKCCDSNTIVSLNAFNGIKYLVKRGIFSGSQTISMLISLLPSINHYGALVSTIGNILLIDFQIQISEKGKYEHPYRLEFQHPFIIILKYKWEQSWFEVYSFSLYLIQMNEDIKLEHKIELLRPVFRHLFWSSSCQGSQLQLKLFNALLSECNEKGKINFALESLLWHDLNIHYCLLLQDFFICLLKKNHDEIKAVLSGVTPMLALAINWLIINGYNPSLWLKILGEAVKIDTASGSVVLFLLTDVIMETPSIYINVLIHVCKSIIFSFHCSKYVVYKFVGVILNWFVSPSFLADPIYKTFEEILDFITVKERKWNDQIVRLNDNDYYKIFGSSKKEVKFAVDLILACDYQKEKTLVEYWLKNLADSNEYQMQLKIHSFIYGILLCENDITLISLCLDILFKLMDRHKEISFSFFCLLFYKLSKETDPSLQNIFLHSLPKLSIKKENIPLIVGTIESLKRGCPKIMTPIIVQLYLLLWKFDSRTYSYLNKMLHDSSSNDFEWELNVSKAIALKDICRLAPHLHAKDLVGVLSRILNECSEDISGLPSAIAIEAVTELCKAYVIDVAGTWNAIQPKLRVDKRPKVIISLCRFFREVPSLSSSESKKEELIKDIIPMLWHYTFLKDTEVVKNALNALSNFPLENISLKLFPEVYRVDIKLPKDRDKKSKTSEDILNLPYVPADLWVQFLEKIHGELIQLGGQLLTVLIERELISLPKGIFYCPPEKSEPLSYSYLPSRSICRALVERLQQHPGGDFASDPDYLKEIIRVLSQEYSKHLPPLNWGFLESLMGKSSGFLLYSLALLAKQGSVSPSAKSILENYFKSVEWNSNKLNEILFIYNLLPLLCKSVSYNTLQNFLKQTIELCLQTSLSTSSPHFQTILQNLKETLKKKYVQPSRKNLIAQQLEKTLILIPPEHEYSDTKNICSTYNTQCYLNRSICNLQQLKRQYKIMLLIMKQFAICATEFPVKLIEEITSVKRSNAIDSNWLRRAVAIRYAIAMRSDIKNPLVWLNEFTDAVAYFPNEQNFILHKICSIIRSRRACDHRIWLQELIWRIQATIADNDSRESNKVILFLINVFITSAIILSGYDCLFINIDEFINDDLKKLEILPPALCVLLSLPDWNDMVPKVRMWLYELSKWKHLSQVQMKAFLQALLTLRELKSFTNENDFSCLFNLFSLPSL